mgnify:CR=1 FL=1
METVKRGYVPKDTKVFPEQRYALWFTKKPKSF